MSTKKKIIYGILLLLLISQFFRIDKTNPEVIPANDYIVSQQIPNDVSMLLINACYDCHSNESEYPWYTNVSPISFWIKGHIKGARQHLNFSEWGTYSPDKQRHKIEECIEVLEDRRMPMKSFTIMHPEAKLSEENFEHLINWFKK